MIVKVRPDDEVNIFNIIIIDKELYRVIIRKREIKIKKLGDTSISRVYKVISRGLTFTLELGYFIKKNKFFSLE
jgi:hypothetical protein